MGKGRRVRMARKAKVAKEIHERSTGASDVDMICPETGKSLSTGVSMNPASFESSGFSDNKTQCPHCGQMHRWGDLETTLAN